MFAQEDTKPVLIDFLNSLLAGERKIIDVTFMDKEQIPEDLERRALIYDIYCTANDGSKFIVEMQNRSQAYFKERSIVYMANAIAKQTEKGQEWKFDDIKAVYFVAFMNHIDDKIGESLRTDIALCDINTKKQFTDKVRLIYLQLPRFTKSMDECETSFDKWIYVINNMDVLGNLPKAFQSEAFNILKDVSNIATMTEKERNRYEAVRKAYWDAQGMYEAAIQEGLAKRRDEVEKLEKNQIEIVRKMKAKSYPIEEISEITGKSIEEINKL
jgi:predicted transposase/invertase (TIGR01784 family)